MSNDLTELSEAMSKLNPEQRDQLAESIGLKSLVATWRAEEVLKDAKRRYESTSSRLNSEQAKYDQIEAAERQRFEARLATLRQGLAAAEVEHAANTVALRDAETVLNDLLPANSVR